MPLIHSYNLDGHPIGHAKRIVDVYDFARLYTDIPQDSLLAALNSLVDQIFTQHGAADVKFTHPAKNFKGIIDTKWVKRRTNGPRFSTVCPDSADSGFVPASWFIWSRGDFSVILHSIVKNTWVQFGGSYFRQHSGIPMGIAPGSSIANLYLGFYELTFMQDLAQLAIDDAIQNSFTPARGPDMHTDPTYLVILAGMRGMGRYIDDLLSVNNPFLEILMYSDQTMDGTFPVLHGLYPRDLSLTSASDVTTPGFAPFMDIGIHSEARGEHSFLQTRLFDKRTLPAFVASRVEITRYIHATSAVDSSCRDNILMGQVLRIGALSGARQDTIDMVSGVLHHLVTKGYLLRFMIKQLDKLVSSHFEFLPADLDRAKVMKDRC